MTQRVAVAVLQDTPRIVKVCESPEAYDEWLENSQFTSRDVHVQYCNVYELGDWE